MSNEASDENPSPAVGDTVLERYRLIEEIGRGGMGVVFSAEHLVTGRQVAVKCIHGRDPVRRERALREARALGRVKHQRVVEIIDAGQEGQWLFVVMEQLRGLSLRQYCYGRQLPVEDAGKIALMALEGAGAAHNCGVLHRDIKLGNIFCCFAESSDWVADVKLLDFGIARSLTGEDPTITRSNELVGSPAYMAPEQLLGEPLDERTDVYALGVVLYSLLAGRDPYRSDSPISVGLQVVAGSSASLTELRDDVTPELAGVVSRAMALKPEHRYSSTDEFSEALQRALHLEDEAIALRGANVSGAEGAEATDTYTGTESGSSSFRYSVFVTLFLLLLGTVGVLLQVL